MSTLEERLRDIFGGERELGLEKWLWLWRSVVQTEENRKCEADDEGEWPSMS